MRAPILLPPLEAKRRRRRKSLLLSILGWCFAAGVVLFVAGAAAAGFVLWRGSRDLPSYDSLAKYEPPVMTRIHANNGALIAEDARERRIFVPINTLPKLLLHAFLSAEGKRFYEHYGLDVIGIIRALYKNLQNPGRRPEGASTITQQVAKNFLLSNEQKFERKLKEAILAIRIERAYSKERILELYLNEIFLGLGSYGVAAASLNYFNKEPKDLEPEEAAYLAALPKGPNNYHPFKKPKEAKTRRDWILDEMANNGYLTRQQANAAKAKPLQVNIRPFGAHIFAGEFFAEEVRRWLLVQREEKDTSYTGGEEALLAGGLSVRTTLDPNLQRMARKALIDGLIEFDRSRGWRGPVQRISVSGDWGPALAQIDVPADIQPWRLGVVIDVQRTKIVVGLRPARQPDGSFSSARDTVEVPYEEMKWAGRFVATDKSKG